MFPSLVNCCTIDWFSEWPDEALRSVASHFLSGPNSKVAAQIPEECQLGIVEVCVDMQSRVTEMSRMYLQSLRRHYYVTPTSYLELISTFSTLFTKKLGSVRQMKER